jgi:hypothetical protein
MIKKLFKGECYSDDICRSLQVSPYMPMDMPPTNKMISKKNNKSKINILAKSNVKGSDFTTINLTRFLFFF